MKTLEYQIKNILDYPRIKELFKMKCFSTSDDSWMPGHVFSSELQTFINLRNTPEAQFHDKFFIEVENLQREYKAFDENNEIIEHDIGEILVGDYTSLKIIEIDWICDWNRNLGFKRIYELNEKPNYQETLSFDDEPPF
jgi:hypothetical protein